MIMSDALCGLSISYSPLSFITSRTLTTAPPFRTSPEEMAAVWAGSSLGQRNGNKKFTGPERPPMQKTFVIPFGGLGC